MLVAELMFDMRRSRYDEIYSERPVRLEDMEGYVMIEGRVYPAKELVEALLQNGYAELRASGDSLVLGRTQIMPVFKSIQERVMASLCYGSLAYCCPLSKRCIDRDRALDVLGLSSNKYEQIKIESHYRFVDTARGKRGRDSHQIYERGGGGLADDGSTRGKEVYSQERTRDYVESPTYRTPVTPAETDAQDEYLTPIQDSRTQRSSAIPIQRGDLSTERNAPSCPVISHSNRQSCDIRQERTDGLGSLFVQGELSPFADEHQDDSLRSFCSSCGRTIKINTVRCPYCGTPQ